MRSSVVHPPPPPPYRAHLDRKMPILFRAGHQARRPVRPLFSLMYFHLLDRNSSRQSASRFYGNTRSRRRHSTNLQNKVVVCSNQPTKRDDTALSRTLTKNKTTGSSLVLRTHQNCPSMGELRQRDVKAGKMHWKQTAALICARLCSLGNIVASSRTLCRSDQQVGWSASNARRTVNRATREHRWTQQNHLPGGRQSLRHQQIFRHDIAIKVVITWVDHSRPKKRILPTCTCIYVALQKRRGKPPDRCTGER